MASEVGVQASRFEFKFVIDEDCASAVRDFVCSYLEPDDYAKNSPDHSYQVNSLYLDSADQILYRQTDCGLKNRFKLRIRFYDGDPQSPTFLEVKRRISGVICKERVAVGRPLVRSLLQGEWPDPTQLAGSGNNGKPAAALAAFRKGSEAIGAAPLIYVSYQREAYVSPKSNHVRITFDRQLLGSPFDWDSFFIPPKTGDRPAIGNAAGVILELKFTDRFPGWMQELVEAFTLQRRSVPKYNLCIETMGLKK